MVDRVYVEAYGCAQNRGEARDLAETLAARSIEIVDRAERAELAILVTCGVIGATESRMLRRWRSLTAHCPQVVVTGCLAPRPELFVGPGRDRTTFVGIRDQIAWAGRLAADRRLDRGPARTAGGPGPDPPRREAAREVVIAQGCTSSCSYCYSRLARGRLQSVGSVQVAERARTAANRGAVEIRLTSLDTAAWGLDLPSGERLPDLLRHVRSATAFSEVRVGMMSPQRLGEIDGALWDAMAAGPFYSFLHLPVQSGSDRVLAEMRRGYTVDRFRSLVDRARSRLPDATLATDVIVGFPGESDEDFRATEQLLEDVRPEIVNVTRYSPRPGTWAARRPPVWAAVAKERSRRITRQKAAIGRASLERWIGRAVTARVVEHGPGGSSVARTRNYLPIVLRERRPFGERVEVVVRGARATYLTGAVRRALPGDAGAIGRV